MSHFGLLVFTATKPGERALAKIMAPYQEGSIGDGGRWDWYQIGGRWTGHLTPQYDPEKDPANREFCTLCLGTGKRKDMKCENGCNGCGGKGTCIAWPTNWKAHAGDQMQIKDIPLAEIRALGAQTAAARWDAFHAILKDRAYPDWNSILEKHGEENIERARAEYHTNPVIREFAGKPEFAFMSDEEQRIILGPRADYIALKEMAALATHAYIDPKGKWHEAGEMGWFGFARNRKEKRVWATMFANAFKALPPDTWVTVIDCHI